VLVITNSYRFYVVRCTPPTFGVTERARRCRNLQLKTYNLKPITKWLGARNQHCADRNHGDPHRQAWC
jgi:hypothetical protein